MCSQSSGLRLAAGRTMPGLLLLAACFCVGLSEKKKLYYGDTLKLSVNQARSLEFVSDDSSDFLWKNDGLTDPKDRRRTMVNGLFTVYNVTQADSGEYIARDRFFMELYRKYIVVRERRIDFFKDSGDSFNFSFNLEPNQCNIYYTSDAQTYTSDPLVSRGRLIDDGHYECDDFRVVRPCGIFVRHLETECAGYFEIRDSDDHAALGVTLQVHSVEVDYGSAVGTGMGIFFLVAGTCGCLKVCCGKSSKKDKDETSDDEPAVHYHESTHLGTGNPPPPVQTHTAPTAPLIHSAPPMDSPPSYSQVMASAPPAPIVPKVAPTFPEGDVASPPTFPQAAPAYLEAAPTFPEAAPTFPEAAAIVPEAAPTFPDAAPTFPEAALTYPMSSEASPQFELRMNFPMSSALGSDTAHSGVYTSDKLNFR